MNTVDTYNTRLTKGSEFSFLHHSIAYFSEKKPEHTAVIQGNTKINYKSLWENTQHILQWLHAHLTTGDRVAVCMDNCAEAVFAMYAITGAGMIVVPLDANMHEKNLGYILHDCEIGTIFTSSKNISKFIKIQRTCALKFLVVCETGKKQCVPYEEQFSFQTVSLHEIMEAEYKKTGAYIKNPHDTTCILYTTGTTGPKKGVELSHYNLVEATRNIIQFMNFQMPVIESLPMPLSHSFGFARLRCVFHVGGTVIIEPGLVRPEIVLSRIEQYKANAISSVPAGFSVMLTYYEELFKRIGKQLEYIEIGSAFMRKTHKEKLMQYCPRARICMHYGLTEASRSAFIEFHSESEQLHTVGKPSPNVAIQVIDDAGQFLNVNKVGEIVVKGEMVMKGYWNKPNITQSAFIDKWLRTGDLGVIDNNGYLHLMGRKKEIINVGGLKVAPGEVEEVLLGFDGIVETAVIGVEDKTNINFEKIIAYIVLSDRHRFIDFKELNDYCFTKIEHYKVPVEFQIVESLPKTNSGKIQKHLLKGAVNE